MRRGEGHKMRRCRSWKEVTEDKDRRRGGKETKKDERRGKDKEGDQNRREEMKCVGIRREETR